MQKFSKPCISTSDFAKICGTSRRTLIHYDEIGLFHPAFTDENGYRYYSESQCDVFFTIRCLKDLGMPLCEIRSFIENRTPDELDSLLENQMREVEKTLTHFMRIRQVIEAKRGLIRAGKDIAFQGRVSNITMEEQPAEFYLATERLDTSNHDILFPALTDHIASSYSRQLNFGHPFGAVLTMQDIREKHYDRYAYFITKTDRLYPEYQCLEKPAGAYLTVYLKGDYYDADDTLRSFAAYADGHHLQTGAFVYKEAIWDELTVMDKRDYITKISVKCEA
ncbi:MAG: MerR family transcriptional regulator [Lachnospiraceae bacterium]|nr:MerR family transcriptional regulator [Lachnospiraceae bacterium]